MRAGVVTIVSLVLLGTVSPPVAAAQADTLHVSPQRSSCTDDGTGSETSPYCTVQAAFDVVEPGQTVRLSGTSTEEVVLTRSGTPDAPIVFTGGAIREPDASAPAITVRGAHDVVITRTDVRRGPGAESVVLDTATRITLDRLSFSAFEPYGPEPGGVRVTGSSEVTISRTSLDTGGAAVHATGGGDLTITGNDVHGFANLGLIADGVDRVAITGNTTNYSCRRAIQVLGGTTGSSIQNNLVRIVNPAGVNGCTGERSARAVEVDAASAPGVTLDYNIVPRLLRWPYRWAGVDHEFADLPSATGQGAHELADDQYPVLAPVDSGNADAPGALDPAANGPRVDDPAVPNTGAGSVTYHDRGATETQDRLSVNSLAVSASRAPVGGDVTVAGAVESAWNVPFTCQVDFGDGTTGTLPSPCSFTHAYTAPGTYTVRASAANASRLTATRTWSLTVVPAGGELTPTMTSTTLGGQTARFTVDPGTTPWNVTSTTFDFGTNTETVAGTSVEHTFQPGTHRVLATVTDAGGRRASTELTYTTGTSGFVRFGPSRLLDTRNGIGAPLRKVAPRTSVRLTLGGRGGIPAGITAVAMNVTVVNATGSGFLTAHPAGSARPNASTVDFPAGRITPSLTITAVGTGGAVDLYNGSGGSVDLIADVTGYFTRTGTVEGYTSMSDPYPLHDSRQSGGVLRAGETRGVHVAPLMTGAGHIPAGTKAVLLNVTAVGPAAPGYLTVFASGTARPNASNLNVVAGQTVANAVVAPVGADGSVSVFTQSETHLVVDVLGFFGGGSYLVPATPVRTIDTRTGIGGPAGALPARSDTTYDLAGDLTLRRPPTAVIYNTKVVNAQRTGLLHPYPARCCVPGQATLAFTPGTVSANLTATEGSRTAFHNASDGTIDLVVDRTGYFTSY